MYRIIILLLISTGHLVAQTISGTITDELGEPLPYVSIYVKNTTNGTITNEVGQYQLSVPAGSNEISYQYVGYETITRSISVEAGRDIVLDITMKTQSLELSEVVIAADREDPAYEIIRRAIARRRQYLNAMPPYQCDVYVKGNQKILKAPEKILGREIGDLDGMLDSTRSGIVYLSESVSELHADGSSRKEIVKSSKISGNPQGYSFNSAKEMEMSFYKNTIDLQRQIVTPIADNAMSYYRYKLTGTYVDDGRVINQIDLWPKRSTDPAFSGRIYITDDEYRIHSLQLHASPEATQIYFIDTLTFNQVYVPLQDNLWALFSNTISFNAGMFGFEVEGEFNAVYSDYLLNPERTSGFFDEYEHIVMPESNERDSAYWQEIRPVPLTVEEVVDYDKKDSVYAVRNDPAYMDSVDRESSQFGVMDIIGGYSYQRRSRGVYFDISSPVNDLNFNTVQGLNSRLSLYYRKYFDEDETRRILTGGDLNYGLAEKKLRARGYLTYRPHRMSPLQVSVRGGRSVTQVNSSDPISARYNSLYSLLTETNHAKYLDLTYLTLAHQAELRSGVLLNTSVSWEERSPLENHTTFSFFKKDLNEYTPNNDLGRAEAYTFDRHQALVVRVGLRLRFGQKYMLRPDERWSMGHSGPTIRLRYAGAYGALGGDVQYHKLAMSLTDQVYTGVTGRLNYYLNAGKYFRQKNMNLRDYRHFDTNETLFVEESDYSSTFMMLPYYLHSTSDHYVQAHLEHHFDGFLLGKVPGIRHLGWRLVAGAKYLHTPEQGDYAEFHVGVDHIGYHILRLGRVDAVLALANGEHQWGARVSIGLFR